MTMSDELERLRSLHERGALSDDEYARAKARVLDGTAIPHPADPALRSINGLRRSRGDRMIGGVCGGIAQSTGIASWVVRLVFALMILFAGTGLLLYVLLWILVPEDTVYTIDSSGQVHTG
jgi:phage shock protein PspC (stress-responsive transcriptional regulator)